LPASGVYSNRASWFGGVAPTSSSHAIFSRSTLGSGYTVTFGGASSVALDRLSLRQGSATLNLGGATLLVNNASAAAPSVAVGGTLKVWNGGNVKLASTGKVGAVSTLGNGKIDATNAAMVVDYAPGPSPIASIGALLSSGYAGGAWTGPGINSSVAALPANFN